MNPTHLNSKKGFLVAKEELVICQMDLVVMNHFLILTNQTRNKNMNFME
jgi:hypothetical protein